MMKKNCWEKICNINLESWMGKLNLEKKKSLIVKKIMQEVDFLR